MIEVRQDPVVDHAGDHALVQVRRPAAGRVHRAGLRVGGRLHVPPPSASTSRTRSGMPSTGVPRSVTITRSPGWSPSERKTRGPSAPHDVDGADAEQVVLVRRPDDVAVSQPRAPERRPRRRPRAPRSRPPRSCRRAAGGGPRHRPRGAADPRPRPAGGRAGRPTRGRRGGARDDRRPRTVRPPRRLVAEDDRRAALPSGACGQAQPPQVAHGQRHLDPVRVRADERGDVGLARDHRPHLDERPADPRIERRPDRGALEVELGVLQVHRRRPRRSPRRRRSRPRPPRRRPRPRRGPPGWTRRRPRRSRAAARAARAPGRPSLRSRRASRTRAARSPGARAPAAGWPRPRRARSDAAPRTASACPRSARARARAARRLVRGRLGAGLGELEVRLLDLQEHVARLEPATGLEEVGDGLDAPAHASPHQDLAGGLHQRPSTRAAARRSRRTNGTTSAARATRGLGLRGACGAVASSQLRAQVRRRRGRPAAGRRGTRRAGPCAGGATRRARDGC